ncbi:MAG: hypothetical protein V2I27_11745 [Erythrobacter sp.]|jgi:hypothetical protein|nr:hypothetical protein [Erythrobacter sp.]
MTTATELIDQAVGDHSYANLPIRVREIVERHRQTLLDLANALIAAGRGEDEVVFIIQQASDNFSIRLQSETEGLQ